MRWLSGVAGALALLAAGCGGTTTADIGASDMVPASAPAFIAVNTDTDSSQWQTVDRLASRFPDKDKALRAFHEGLNGAGLSWKKEIKPILGPEVDLAWLDFDNDGEDVVILMQPRDEQKFLKVVEDQGAIFHAKVGDWQVLSPTKQVLERFRAESGSGDTLSDKNTFRQAMGSYPDDTLFRAYVDGATLMGLAKREAQSDPEIRRALPQLGRLDWIATNLRATDDGIRWDFNVHGTPGHGLKGITPTRPFSPALSHEVPKDAIAYWSFHGTKGMLQGLDRNPLFQDVPEIHRYRGVLSQIGKLLEGENALYVRPGTGSTPEVTFIADPGSGTNGAAVLDRLLARYRTQLGVAPQRVTISGTPTRKLGFGKVAGYYANVGGKLVLTDLPAGIRSVKQPGAALSESETYRDAKAASGLPSKSQGFLYVDIHSTIPFVERLSHANLPPTVSRNLKPLHSAMEYAVTHSHEIQVTLFLRIK
jgi:hypothetical protein